MSWVLLFLASWAGTGLYLRWAARRNWGQVVREEGPPSHEKKRGIPTSGGLVFGGLLLLLALPLWPVICTVVLLLAMGLGYLDDYWKRRVSRYGLRARYRLLAQGALGLLLGVWAFREYGGAVAVPFLGSSVDLGAGRVLLDVLFVMGLWTGINFTDGLDGLLAGVYCLFLFGLAAAAGALAGPAMLAVPVLLGFLWWNAYPARVFMGEVGTAALTIWAAVWTMQWGLELLVPLVGALFVLEVLSVILQVLYFRRTGRRIFRMAPFHHHLELAGWPEPRVVVRFWIVQALLAWGAQYA